MSRVAESVPYPRFSAVEFAARLGRVRELMEADGLDALVVFGNGGSRFEIQFLTGWPPRHDSFLVIGGEAEPTLLVQLYNHVPTAQSMSSVGDVRWGGVESTATVAEELRRRGKIRHVGSVGPIPFQQVAKLTAAIQPASLVDATSAFRRMRLIKSDEEIAWTRRGAELCDMAMEGCWQSPGPAFGNTSWVRPSSTRTRV